MEFIIKLIQVSHEKLMKRSFFIFSQLLTVALTLTRRLKTNITTTTKKNDMQKFIFLKFHYEHLRHLQRAN